MRPDRPNRVSPHRIGGAAALAAAAAVVTVLSACTTGGPDAKPSSGGATPTLPSTSGLQTPTTPTTPTDTGLPTDSTPSSTAATTSKPPSSPPASSTHPAATVTVFVSYHDWIAADRVAEVDALIPDKVIANGTCTLRMTRGSLTRTATHKATPAPSSTSCGALTIPGSKLSAGTWTAVVTFTSPSATGSSDPVTITVTK